MLHCIWLETFYRLCETQTPNNNTASVSIPDVSGDSLVKQAVLGFPFLAPGLTWTCTLTGQCKPTKDTLRFWRTMVVHQSRVIPFRCWFLLFPSILSRMIKRKIGIQKNGIFRLVAFSSKAVSVTANKGKRYDCGGVLMHSNASVI